MNVLVIVCHPLPESFNFTVADRIVQTLSQMGHTVKVHDLYKEGFEPVLSGEELSRGMSFDEAVLDYSLELEACAGLILVHPDWWGLPPALLKGWVDRIFRPGIAYELQGEEFLPKRSAPLLNGKKALVFVTSDASMEKDVALVERFWQESVFAYCGIAESKVHVLRNMHRLDQGDRIAWLRFVAETLPVWFPPS
jgi:NAD(P)H dehydrogenase (quinone)